MALAESALTPTRDTRKSPGVHYVTTKKEELDFCYTVTDKLFQLSLGKNAHFSNARFMGDFSLTLEEAQAAKCEYIARMCNMHEGSRVLDLGCGWGGMLRYFKTHYQVEETGVVFAKGQYEHCVETGLNVHYQDMRTVTPADLGTFDAVTACGSIDHVLSYDEFLEGKQEEVYRRWFDTIADLLPIGGRHYMQTMTLGRKIIPRETWDINAPTDSDEFTMALMVKMFPMSWLPYMDEDIIKYASHRFKLVEHSSGRLDYIETTRRWSQAYRKFGWKKTAFYLSLVPKVLFDKEFRHVASFMKYRPNNRTFERELFDHYRFVFERIA